MSQRSRFKRRRAHRLLVLDDENLLELGRDKLDIVLL